MRLTCSLVLGDFDAFTPVQSAARTVPPVIRASDTRMMISCDWCPYTNFPPAVEPWLTNVHAAPAGNPAPPPEQSGVNISPDTAVTNWSSAPVTDWPATPTSYAKREALVSISKIFPRTNEDILLLALEEHDFNVNDAVDLLAGTGMDDPMTTFLVRVFPRVKREIIDREISDCYGKYLNVFLRMVMKYHDYWKPHPDPTTSALSLSPPTRYRPDFVADGLEEETVEASWWKSLADTVRWQVQPPPPDELTWRTVVSACHLTHKSWSPRLAGMVRNLSGPDHSRALSSLKTLLAYSLMVDLASNESHRALCLGTVTALASNGVAAPGAVAWAFEMSSKDPAENFVIRHAASTYEKTSSTIWLARNKAMLAHREKAFGSTQGHATIDVDADEEQDGFSVKDVPASPTVSRVTRTSAGTRAKVTKASSPYPAVKPKGKARASDDDVRAAESTVKGKRAVHDDIIELTSESDADQEDQKTAERPSLASEMDTSADAVEETPRPVIMSPSIVSPRKKTGRKPAPAKRSPVKTRSTRIDPTNLP